MKAHFLAAISLFSAVLIHQVSYWQLPAKADVGVLQAEYQVLSAYISSEFIGARGEDRVGSRVLKIVIAKDSQSDIDDSSLEDDDGKPIPWKKMSGYLHKKAHALQASTLNSFRNANIHAATFNPSFQLPIAYELVDKTQFDAIFNKGGWWTDFYKKYPNSQGFLILSRVGFSSDGQQAVFYTSNSCGGKCGTGSYVVMEKTAQGWKVAKEIIMWIS